jgi:hypothetical protein
MEVKESTTLSVIYLERKLLGDFLTFVPGGHVCVRANHASHIVGQPCRTFRGEAVQVIRVF